MELVNNIPQQLFDIARIQVGIEAILDTNANGAKADFEKTTATWQHRVRFGVEKRPFERIISTDDPIYSYVDEGTPPHDILPRTKKVLAFRPNSVAKTAPGVIGSGGGSKGGSQVIAHAVHHPGTKARKFSETLQEKWEQHLQRDLDSYFAGGL